MVKEGMVYILKSQKNSSFYIGSTIDIANRFKEHNNSRVCATRNLRPLELVFFQTYPSISEARKIEYRLKKLKSRKIVERIIEDRKINLGL